MHLFSGRGSVFVCNRNRNLWQADGHTEKVCLASEQQSKHRLKGRQVLKQRSALHTGLALCIWRRCSRIITILNKACVICCRYSHRFLPLFDYHAILAAEGLGITEIIARLKNRCIFYIGTHYILTTSKILKMNEIF